MAVKDTQPGPYIYQSSVLWHRGHSCQSGNSPPGTTHIVLPHTHTQYCQMIGVFQNFYCLPTSVLQKGINDSKSHNYFHNLLGWSVNVLIPFSLSLYTYYIWHHISKIFPRKSSIRDFLQGKKAATLSLGPQTTVATPHLHGWRHASIILVAPAH